MYSRLICGNTEISIHEYLAVSISRLRTMVRLTNRYFASTADILPIVISLSATTRHVRSSFGYDSSATYIFPGVVQFICGNILPMIHNLRV